MSSVALNNQVLAKVSEAAVLSAEGNCLIVKWAYQMNGEWRDIVVTQPGYLQSIDNLDREEQDNLIENIFLGWKELNNSVAEHVQISPIWPVDGSDHTSFDLFSDDADTLVIALGQEISGKAITMIQWPQQWNKLTANRTAHAAMQVLKTLMGKHYSVKHLNISTAPSSGSSPKTEPLNSDPVHSSSDPVDSRNKPVNSPTGSPIAEEDSDDEVEGEIFTATCKGAEAILKKKNSGK